MEEREKDMPIKVALIKAALMLEKLRYCSKNLFVITKAETWREVHSAKEENPRLGQKLNRWIRCQHWRTQ